MTVQIPNNCIFGLYQVWVKYNQFRPFMARNIDVQYIVLDKGLLLEDLNFNKS